MRSRLCPLLGLLVSLGALSPAAHGASPSRHGQTLARSVTGTPAVPVAITPLLRPVAFPTTGVLRTLLVPISWPGATQVQNEARLAGMLAGLAAYYAVISQGRLTIAGQVATPVALSGQALAGRGLADSEVGDTLRARGGEPAAYDLVVYAYPHIADADWDGQADTGISAPGGWIDLNGDQPVSQLAHELGHTLGLVHAHAYRCSRGILEGRCTLDEYGDSTDLMGSGSNDETSTFNALERFQLGWLTHVAGISATGIYQLGPIDAPDAGPLPRALVLETSRGELWIERAIGRGTFYVHLAHPSNVDWGSRLLVPGATSDAFSASAPFVGAGVTITPRAAAGGVLTLEFDLR